MANITYSRTILEDHKPWIDGEDVVEAAGEKGFNKKFQDIEAEFDRIGTVVGQINVALQTGLTIQPVITLAKQLNPNQVTDPEDIDVYNNADFPAGIKKVYQVSIEPAPGAHGQVSYNLIYAPAPGDKTKVSIWFKEEKNTLTRITAKVFSIS
jgi:hypothetical protein